MNCINAHTLVPDMATDNTPPQDRHLHPFRVLFIGFLFNLLSLSVTQAQQNDFQKHPTDNWPTIGPPKGTLMIIGGAAVPATYSYFIELIGGPEKSIVFIPTAGDTVDENNVGYIGLLKAGATNVTILHTRDPEEANSPQFVAPLRNAEAVFIAGGFQNRLAAAYLNTLTHQLMFDLLDRGGVIAGSSAGASIQGSFLYGGGEKQPVGFGFVKKSAIGQHYIRRNRMGTVARILDKYPDLFGFGVDEATAAVVRGNQLEVFGNGKIAIYDPHRPDWPENRPSQYLFSGDKYDIASRRMIHEAALLPNDLWAEGGEKKWISPSIDWITNSPPKGKLLLYGSEKTDTLSLQHFIKSLPNPNAPIVVLSTGDEEIRAENQLVMDELKKLGAGTITFLHTINSNRANSQSFATALSNAEAVWICDSRSWQIVDSYLYTWIHQGLFALLQRNGTIGGNGSGALVMASRLFGEPENYKWHTGLGIAKNTLIFNDQLSLKAWSNVHGILEKAPEMLAIALSPHSKLRIEHNYIREEGTGISRIYKDTKEKPIILSPGESFNLRN